MTFPELLADLVMVVHAAFSLFVVVGLIFILAGLLLRWNWINHRPFRVIHLAATLIVVARVWLGVPCPFSVVEDRLRTKTSSPCVFAPIFHDALRSMAFRRNDANRFMRSATILGLVVVGVFLLGARRTAPQCASPPKRGLGKGLKRPSGPFYSSPITVAHRRSSIIRSSSAVDQVVQSFTDCASSSVQTAAPSAVRCISVSAKCSRTG